MTSKDFFEEVKYEWCASEHQSKPLLNDIMKFAKLYHKEQLTLTDVVVPKETLVCEHPLDKRASVKSHEKDFCWKCGKHITN
jgi:hypothetical protein|tara:strand:+ start:1954 stop:2199 length:246 start_codon:yes stop_codon:yes gene_type:complete